jgi:hypothetical protein
MKDNNIIKRLGLVFLSIIILSAAVFLYFNPPNAINSAGLQIEYHGEDQHASVFLDNQYLEKAPLSERSIQSGDHILKIVPDDQNLAEFSTPITLTKGALTVVSYSPGSSAKESSVTIYELEKVDESAELGSISFESYPENALLSFDQQASQYTPIVFENLTPNEYSYTVSLPSYQVHEHTLQVLAGYQIKASIKLAKLSETDLNTEQESEPEPVATDSALLDAELEKDESWGVADPQLIVGNKVKIKKTNFFIDRQEVLRVREEASKTAKELGFAKSDFYYPYAGDVEENDQNAEASPSAQFDDWIKIRFEGQEGWISGEFAELIIDQQEF